MQHFQRRAQFFNTLRQRSRNHASRFHAEHWPQPLAAGKHAVAHGFVDRLRMLRLQRNEPVERGVGQLPSLFESLGEHEAVSITRPRIWELSAAMAGGATEPANKKDAPLGVFLLQVMYRIDLRGGGSRNCHTSQNRS